MSRRAAVAALLALSGCAVERTKALPVIHAADVGLIVEEGGPWAEASSEPSPSDTEGFIATPAAPAAPEPTVPRPVVAEASPAQPSLPLPARRGPAPRDSLGAPPVKSPALLARERHLDNPTRIRAERITFRCPARYLPEVRRRADQVVQEAPGRTVLTGGARLSCRELTLEAERIVLDARPDAAEVHLSARGDVSFVSVQRGQAMRHEGVRSLLVIDDRVVPLR